MSNGSGTAGQSGSGEGQQGAQGTTQGATQGANWREMIPAELAQDPSLASIKDFPSLVKGYISAQSMIGAEKIALPAGKNDTPEYWSQVFDKLGRPKDPDGYQVKLPAKEKIPEGIEINEERLKGFKTLAHEVGLLPGQVQKLIDWHMGEVLKDYQGFTAGAEKAYEAGVAAMRERFGAKADEMVDVANRVLKTFGGSPEEISLIAEKYGNDPLITGLLAQIGVSMRESSLVRGERPSFDLNANDAKLRKQDILSNKQNPLNEAYFNKRHPRHEEAVKEVMRLNEVLSMGG